MQDSLTSKFCFDITILLPKILGDSMMSVQAILSYQELFIDRTILVIVDPVFKNLFKIIFPDYIVASYSEIASAITTEKLIDFRGDKISNETKLKFKCFHQHTFDFENELKIISQSKAQKQITPFSVINKTLDTENPIHQFAWVMDSVLISKAFDVTLKFPYQNLKTELPSNTIKNILCFPCGTNSLKHYPVENWQIIIKQLVAEGFNVNVFLGINEKHYEVDFSDIVPTFVNMPIESIVNAYFSPQSLALANDCGLLHVSALFGVKTIGLFGTTNEKIWFPYHYGYAVRSKSSLWENPMEVLKIIRSMC